MMADLVRDHIGLGEIAGGREAPLELLEEAGVEIDAPVGRAIEGAHRRIRGAAAGTAAAGVKHHPRHLILPARLAEHLGPALLGRAKHLAGETGHRIGLADIAALRLGLARLRRDRLLTAADQIAETAEDQEQDNEDDDAADAEAAGDQADEHPGAAAEAAATAA